MNPKLSRLQKTVLLAVGIFGLTGCPKKRMPTPADTVIRSPESSVVRTEYGHGLHSFDYSTSIQDPYSEDLSIDAVPEHRDQSLQDADRVAELFPSVYFEFDQSFINADERTKLTEVVNSLKSNPKDNILIEGYCDWRGTTEYNLGLGDRRANAVKIYLEQLGIEPQRIQTLSKGDLEATVSGAQEQLAQDRRTDLIVLR